MRVRVSVNPNPNPNPKTAFFKKKIDPDPGPGPDPAFYQRVALYHSMVPVKFQWGKDSVYERGGDARRKF